MKRYTTLLLLLAFCGYAKDRQAVSLPVVPSSTPEQVIADFAAELNTLAARYPELSAFPKYYESLPDKLRIRFCSGMKPIKTKRYVRPDDFERHGIFLQFDLCDERLPCTPTINATTRRFANLHLQLYAEVNLSASPSPGLHEEIQRLFKHYIAQLEQLNQRISQQGAEGDAVDRAP